MTNTAVIREGYKGVSKDGHEFEVKYRESRNDIGIVFIDDPEKRIRFISQASILNGAVFKIFRSKNERG